jgi:TctA family transporter
VLFGLAGTDSATNAQRYTFGIFEMSDGIDFVPIAMGLFGIAEIISNLEQRTHAHGVTPIDYINEDDGVTPESRIAERAEGCCGEAGCWCLSA